MHLWSYESFNERARLREGIVTTQAVGRRISAVGHSAFGASRHSSDECFPTVQAPTSEGNIYEFRNYRAQPGKAKEWAKLLLESCLPARSTRQMSALGTPMPVSPTRFVIYGCIPISTRVWQHARRREKMTIGEHFLAARLDSLPRRIRPSHTGRAFTDEITGSETCCI